MKNFTIINILDDLIARVPEGHSINYIVISKNLMRELIEEQIPEELHTAVRITNFKGHTLDEKDTPDFFIQVVSSVSGTCYLIDYDKKHL